jgi:hypothetical protein
MSAKTDKDAANLTGLAKKWDNLLKKMPEFKSEAEAADVAGLKKIIVVAEGNIYTANKEEEADQKLAGVREMVKELSELYRDAKNHQQAKIQYALLLLEGKGVDLDNKSKDGDEG